MTKEICAKVPYDTPAEARAALAQVRGRKGKNHAQEKRAYRCQRCGRYHLTKMSARNDKTSTHRRYDHE